MKHKAEKRTLLHEGRYANADVWLVERDGKKTVRKDFSARAWIVRHTLGRRLIRHEARVLAALEPCGCVPRNAKRISPVILEEEFCKGRVLREHPGALPASFFAAFEDAVRAVHAKRYVHLDLRNARNIIVTPEFAPVLLDWQSAVRTRFLPGPVRRFFERVDMAAVYKHWSRFSPETFPPDRRAEMERFLKLRKWWVLRGYMFSKRRY